jgi:hypothetical protein
VEAAGLNRLNRRQISRFRGTNSQSTHAPFKFAKRLILPFIPSANRNHPEKQFRSRQNPDPAELIVRFFAIALLLF